MAWPWGVVVAVDALAWAAIGLAAGWWFSRVPVERLGDGPFTRLRRFEAGGAWYRRHLRVHRWKAHLPEAGALFGGVSKRRLPAGVDHDARLARFAQECRRGERAHWVVLASTPLFALWNPPALFAAMVAYAVAANGPCLVVLRANRARCVEARRRHALR